MMQKMQPRPSGLIPLDEPMPIEEIEAELPLFLLAKKTGLSEDQLLELILEKNLSAYEVADIWWARFSDLEPHLGSTKRT